MLPVAAAAVPVNTPPRPRAAYGASRSKTPLPPDEVHRRAQAEGLTLLRSAGASVSGYRFVFTCSSRARHSRRSSRSSRAAARGSSTSATSRPPRRPPSASRAFIAQPNSHVSDSEVRDALDQTVLPPPPQQMPSLSTTSQDEAARRPATAWTAMASQGAASTPRVAPAAPARRTVAATLPCRPLPPPVVLQPPPPIQGQHPAFSSSVVVASVDVDPSTPVVAPRPCRHQRQPARHRVT